MRFTCSNGLSFVHVPFVGYLREDVVLVFLSFCICPVSIAIGVGMSLSKWLWSNASRKILSTFPTISTISQFSVLVVALAVGFAASGKLLPSVSPQVIDFTLWALLPVYGNLLAIERGGSTGSLGENLRNDPRYWRSKKSQSWDLSKKSPSILTSPTGTNGSDSTASTGKKATNIFFSPAEIEQLLKQIFEARHLWTHMSSAGSLMYFNLGNPEASYLLRADGCLERNQRLWTWKYGWSSSFFKIVERAVRGVYPPASTWHRNSSAMSYFWESDTSYRFRFPHSLAMLSACSRGDAAQKQALAEWHEEVHWSFDKLRALVAHVVGEDDLSKVVVCNATAGPPTCNGPSFHIQGPNRIWEYMLNPHTDPVYLKKSMAGVRCERASLLALSLSLAMPEESGLTYWTQRDSAGPTKSETIASSKAGEAVLDFPWPEPGSPAKLFVDARGRKIYWYDGASEDPSLPVGAPELVARIAKKPPGSLVSWTYDLLHAVSPYAYAPGSPNDQLAGWRITMQAFGIKCGDKWYVYHE